jgi:hypothetical protein
MEINPDDVMPEMGKKNPEALLPGEIFITSLSYQK